MSYLLCGLHAVSDFPLPGVARWTGPDGAPDVQIRLGRLREGASQSSDYALVDVRPDGSCRLNVKDIASFRIEDGCRIIVDPDHHADETLVQVFLLGSAFGFLIHQRGLLPLHAGCVELGGQAVAFAGESGAGKSTLVAAFVQAGFPMLADDITVIDPHAAGGPVVLPSFPRIKLWRHALDGLGISALELPRVRDELDKYLLPADAHFRTEPLPLGALYHLSQVNEPQQAGVEPLRGKEAIDGILDAVYRRRSALAMRRHGSMLAAAMRLGNVPQARLRRYPDLSLLPKTVQEITARHA